MLENLWWNLPITRISWPIHKSTLQYLCLRWNQYTEKNDKKEKNKMMMMKLTFPKDEEEEESIELPERSCHYSVWVREGFITGQKVG